MKYKNKKNGKIYKLLSIGTDATNSRDGLKVAIYCSDDDTNCIFVRDYVEFSEKFYEILS